MADTKEWTLMFYFACDNALAPGVVTQLKALKQAGFHPDVNVVVQFDPQTADTPTHIFDVNLMNKVKRPGEADIGFAGNDPYVRTLMEDKLWSDQLSRGGKDKIRDLLQKTLAAKGFAYDPPIPPPETRANGGTAPTLPGTTTSTGMTITAGGATARGDDRPHGRKEPGPKESLESFLKFCSQEYRAKHYMLFILGHGMVVGNDIFLFDEHVDSDQHSLSLIDLGIVLNDFSQYIRYQNAEFELVSFHSCSVSSLEVAYQLQYDAGDQLRGAANYMLASQGPAFVGSWPYREIVIRVFNDVARLKKNGTPINVKEMLGKIFDYVFNNCSDFLLAGYSFQLTLCDLNKVSGVTASLKKLSDDLVKGLGDPAVRNLILLAHWKSISYWGENYTDLHDFCFCLSDLCKESGLSGMVDTIQADCGQVMDQLSAGDNRLINRVNFAGPTYQYSHGLSVFYPWVTPQDDFMDVYEDYRFGVTAWKSFLKAYLDETERATLREELGQRAPVLSPEDELEEDIASICFNNEGPLNTPGALSARAKTGPRDPTGDDCACGTIKNYPHDTRPRRERNKQPLGDPLPLGPDAINLFS